jgi:hypothetical protein
MEWYEADVQSVEKQLKQLPYKPLTLFYGSSSIRLWQTLYDDFKPYSPANMGFGGATLEACVYFFSRLMQHTDPKHLIVYAGDNDLGDGKTSQAVLGYFLQLNLQIRNRFGNIPCTFISIKPSIARWNINNTIKHTNELIEKSISKMSNTYFLDVYSAMLDETGLPVKHLYDTDGLHLSGAGYEVWKTILLTHISFHSEAFVTAC